MQIPENVEVSATRKCSSNKGKIRGTKPPLQTKHVWAIRTKLQVDGKIRELAMFNLGDRQQAARLRPGSYPSG